jgi:transposase
MANRKLGHDYEISEEFWNRIKPVFSLTKLNKKAERPRKDDKKIMSCILYLLRTGSQWKSLPRFYGAPSTIHDR